MSLKLAWCYSHHTLEVFCLKEIVWDSLPVHMSCSQSRCQLQLWASRLPASLSSVLGCM